MYKTIPCKSFDLISCVVKLFKHVEETLEMFESFPYSLHFIIMEVIL